ncbi:hypothetical protein BDV24DRAFT_152808 [Aspergillus arachidicola]|uniref:Uncharacterized protein n=1 Tax=Aspergillus arachidicola TaxID=656916 RepID=A0A5N6Y2P2_9EURO|nr:hypothetical protein BDV24DRAFT_152808 [Aspergillus arachidicola]
MTSEQNIHIGQSLCVLCRQAATVRSHILNPIQKSHTVPDCRYPCGGCSYSPYPMLWFHAACYDKPTFKDLRRFVDVTRPVYKCEYKEYKETISVMEGLFSKYTREIIEDSRISKIKYRGTYYVAQLSSKPLELISTFEQYHIKLPIKISKIILSADCIGIHGIQFVGPQLNPKSDGLPWYEVQDTRETDLEISMSCNGLFIRSIQAWSSPFPPKFHPWNFYQARGKSRLDYIKIDSHIQGVLVCCANAKIVRIHGFSDISESFREFIDLMNRRKSNSYKHWIYFPFNKHEYTKAAWIRKFRLCHGPASNPILVVSRSLLVPHPWLTSKLQTSLGRTITFGPQFPARIINQYEYHPLVRDGDDPATKYISDIGVTCNDVGTLGSSPSDARIEPPTVPPGRGSSASTWYVTKASLKGLVNVYVCSDKEQPHHPCLGLLLYYSDGHINQETVRPIYIENGTVDGRDYIKDIQSGIYDTDLKVKRSGWQKVPERGIIAWWFSRLGDQIIT